MAGKLGTTLTILVIIVALFFGYRYFFVSEPTPDLETTQPAAARESAQAGKDFLVALVNLQQINLNAGAAVLSDPSFARLEDMSVSLPSEQSGRSNPFGPIGSESAAQ